MSKQSNDVIAEVLISSPLPHLNRTFDYLVPEKLQDQVQFGVRVKVRFGGSERDGYVLGVREHTDFAGELRPIRTVVSSLPVFTPDLLAQWVAIANWYGGTRSDVFRLAIPPRHARAEKAALAAQKVRLAAEVEPQEDFEADPKGSRGGASKPSPGEAGKTDLEAHSQSVEIDMAQGSESADPEFDELTTSKAWNVFPGGLAFLRRVSQGLAPRAVWAALPEPHPVAGIVTAVAANEISGRSTIVVAPTASEVSQISEGLDSAGVKHVVLTAAAGPHARYRRYVDALIGETTVVVGNRSAIFAPLADLGLIVIWDDGNPTLREQRMPYPHVRDIARIRAEHENASVLIGGYHRTTYAQEWVETGWARSLAAPRDYVRSVTPRVQALSDVDRERDGSAGWARIPPTAHRLISEALTQGPVLIHVPRRGYVPVIGCDACGTHARCTKCHGPLQFTNRDRLPQCTWCGSLQSSWRCAECEGTKIRARRIGSSRTAEELGRAFPDIPVHVSASDEDILDEVDSQPRLVIATPGAEPKADGGYRALLILDSHVTTSHPHIDAASEALRRWLHAAALVQPQGKVMVTGLGDNQPIQALVRWDPLGFTARELAERKELYFPPTVRMVRIEGETAAVEAAAEFLADAATVLGVFRIPDSERARVLARVPVEQSRVLTAKLQELQASRSAKRTGDPLHVTLDPISL